MSTQQRKFGNSVQKEGSLDFFSPAFGNKDEIPKKYRHVDGDDVSIPLQINHVPTNTESLALVMVDEDTPNDELLHWMVWNIDPKKREIEEGEQPGVTGKNSWRVSSYRGPCPLEGVHNYKITLFALDRKLDISEHISYREFMNEIKPYTIAKDHYWGWVETSDEFAIE